tara:strand:+ start:601 stop:1773 length:1173 start_codon:yes stop_codon:yes gene_type:complete
MNLINNNCNKYCNNCIYDSNVSGITFDSYGVCNYCNLINSIKKEYKTGTHEGEKNFQIILNKIKSESKKKKYDAVVGVSGGTDSSYLLWLMKKKYNLRILAVHYDNTWNTSIATQNIKKITSKLDIDLFTYVCDNEESDDIFKSFFYAGVPEIDGPTDIALMEVLYRAASKFKIKYIFEGHSFIAEGISPLGVAYVDGRYIKKIHEKFGKIKMKTFPNMSLLKFLYWTIIKRVKRIRPLWYINYSKEEAISFLKQEFNWEYYGGHHLENRMTAFHHSYYNPKKFKIDQRNNSLSASVRNKKISKKEALDLYREKPFIEKNLLDYFKKRLNISDDEFNFIMLNKPKYYFDYKTYKKYFEVLRPFFFLCVKFNLVPYSFYKKYCFKDEIKKN